DIAAGPVLRFLLLTGLRLGEAYSGERQGQHWVVSAKAAKNGKEHRVWLSPLALAQLEAHPWTARREQVQHWLTANAAARGLPRARWRAHDLRPSFQTLR